MAAMPRQIDASDILAAVGGGGVRVRAHSPGAVNDLITSQRNVGLITVSFNQTSWGSTLKCPRKLPHPAVLVRIS